LIVVIIRISINAHYSGGSSCTSSLGLKTMLEEQPELKLVGEAADAQDLLMLAIEHPAKSWRGCLRE
jgi:hypothetical protein